VPAGTFDAIVLRKVGGSEKRYWYVRGVGKVKETGGQVEELVSWSTESGSGGDPDAGIAPGTGGAGGSQADAGAGGGTAAGGSSSDGGVASGGGGGDGAPP
jgi:hypothetical protein